MSDSSPTKILIILPNNLGDVIMTLPILDGFKEKNPLCHITFFVEEGFEGGLENHPSCDLLYRFPRKFLRDKAIGLEWKDGLLKLKEIVNELKEIKFDLVINYAQHPYLAYIVSLLEAKEVKGGVMLREGNLALTDPWSQYLYTIPYARNFNRFHATDIYKRIADVKNSSFPKIVLTMHEKNSAEDYLRSKKVPLGSRIVIFQPGASFSSKRWPTENFIALGRMLIDDGYHIVITGAPAERDIGLGIFNELQSQCTLTSGELSFRQTIAITSFCELCITGDTALMHAAACLQKKVCAIFGSTSPVETGPYGAGHLIFAGRCVNRPCFCTECKSKLCMKAILPEYVYGAIKNSIPANASCDIYSTYFDSDGLYTLKPETETSGSYYNYTGAQLTWRAFDSTVSSIAENTEYYIFKDQSLKIISIIKAMESELNSYILDKNSDALRNFEIRKNDLTSVKDIGEFWTALLNARLNSVPLLNFNEGTIRSLDACRVTRKQIESIFES